MRFRCEAACQACYTTAQPAVRISTLAQWKGNKPAVPQTTATLHASRPGTQPHEFMHTHAHTSGLRCHYSQRAQ